MNLKIFNKKSELESPIRGKDQLHLFQNKIKSNRLGNVCNMKPNNTNKHALANFYKILHFFSINVHIYAHLLKKVFIIMRLTKVASLKYSLYVGRRN